MMEDLHLKYRPKTFDEVIGHEETIKSIQHILKKGIARTFLFTGPSGVGKTTLARIIASEVGCLSENIVEIDAATFTGIDAMRSVTDSLRYKAFGKIPQRAIIVDEVHALSKQAFQSLLKSLEEPPEYVYWLLCTTEPSKIPATVKTRSIACNLNPLKEDDIFDLLVEVCSEEGFDTPDDILGLIARKAEGSPRQALVHLSMAFNCKSRNEAAIVLDTVTESKEIIDLCRLLAKGKGLTWAKAMKIVEQLKDQNAESVRLVVVSYFSSVLLSCKSDDVSQRALFILDCFSDPCYQSDRMAPILLSLGRVIYEV